MDVSENVLVASSTFATRLEGKSRLRARVVGTAEAPFTLRQIETFENAVLFLLLGPGEGTLGKAEWGCAVHVHKPSPYL